MLTKKLNARIDVMLGAAVALSLLTACGASDEPCPAKAVLLHGPVAERCVHGGFAWEFRLPDLGSRYESRPYVDDVSVHAVVQTITLRYEPVRFGDDPLVRLTLDHVAADTMNSSADETSVREFRGVPVRFDDATPGLARGASWVEADVAYQLSVVAINGFAGQERLDDVRQLALDQLIANRASGP